MSALLKRDQKVIDMRRHQRVSIPALGRYMLSDQQEHACQTIDMSPGGLALLAPVRGAIGERVVCYLDYFGRLEGQIVRILQAGFAMQFSVPLSKREKLAEQLTWHANRGALGVPEARYYERIVPNLTRSSVHTQDGRTLPAELIDVSMSGAAFQCDLKPEIGTLLVLGQRPCRVTRVSGDVIAVEFLRLIPREVFDEAIVL